MVFVSQTAIAQPEAKRCEISKQSERIPGQPYEKFTTRDRFWREIVFYLSTAAAGRATLPLVAFIERSGCSFTV